MKSPWEGVKEDQQPQVKAEDNAPVIRYTVSGRIYEICVAFRTFDKDRDKLAEYALVALGMALESCLKAFPNLVKMLEQQSIVLSTEKAPWPKVTLALGPVTIYAKAGSFDTKTAALMAFDRLALCLTDEVLDAKGREALKSHLVKVNKKANG